MDNKTREERSDNMSKIRGKNTKPEMAVRRFLYSHGLRYRINVSGLPGKPDIKLTKYKTVIFVNGCFWHKHDCKRYREPKSNSEYWQRKIEGNVKRDEENYKKLEQLGWNVVVVWECEINEKTLLQLVKDLTFNK